MTTAEAVVVCVGIVCTTVYLVACLRTPQQRPWWQDDYRDLARRQSPTWKRQAPTPRWTRTTTSREDDTENEDAP